jgi:hypothetical protein
MLCAGTRRPFSLAVLRRGAARALSAAAEAELAARMEGRTVPEGCAATPHAADTRRACVLAPRLQRGGSSARARMR